MNAESLTGRRFNRWTVIGDRETKAIYGQRRPFYLCQCDCGTQRILPEGNIKTGHSKSCGCHRADVSKTLHRTHGMTGTRLYAIYRDMITRTTNPNYREFYLYGGRGVFICQEWSVFESFRDWALSNGYASDLTIERKDVNGNYSPANCTWITKSEQQRNKRNNHNLTAFGETKIVMEWARDPRCVVPWKCLYYRLKSGWAPEDAITMPQNSGATYRPSASA